MLRYFTVFYCILKDACNISTLVSLLTLVAEKMKWTNYFHIRVLCKKQGTISIINGKSLRHFLTEVMAELT